MLGYLLLYDAPMMTRRPVRSMSTPAPKDESVGRLLTVSLEVVVHVPSDRLFWMYAALYNRDHRPRSGQV